VFGGLLGLLLTSARASRGAYRADYYPGLGLLGIYWHFLAVLWLVLFGVLKGTS
jgi:heme/copper-type cytochrome/quinol oxidase subunit 3